VKNVQNLAKLDEMPPFEIRIEELDANYKELLQTELNVEPKGFFEI